MEPYERIHHRNRWEPREPTRWERLQAGLIQLTIITGTMAAIILAIVFVLRGGLG